MNAMLSSRLMHGMADRGGAVGRKRFKAVRAEPEPGISDVTRGGAGIHQRTRWVPTAEDGGLRSWQRYVVV